MVIEYKLNIKDVFYIYKENLIELRMDRSTHFNLTGNV